MIRAASALALALALAPSAASAFCRTTTALQTSPTMCAPGGVPLAWTGGCAGLRINTTPLPRGVTAEVFRAAVQDSSAAWNAVTCDPATGASPSFQVLLLPDTAASAGFSGDEPNQNTVGFRADWNDEFHPRDAASITVVTFNRSTGAILDADIELNAGMPFTLDGADNAVDLRTALMHELGHTLGLAHSPERAAVMWYSAGMGERRVALHADDALGLCAVYPPGRAARCDPEVRAQATEGGGASCAVGTRRSRVAWAAFAMVVAAMAARRRR